MKVVLLFVLLVATVHAGTWTAINRDARPIVAMLYWERPAGGSGYVRLGVVPANGSATFDLGQMSETWGVLYLFGLSPETSAGYYSLAGGGLVNADFAVWSSTEPDGAGFYTSWGGSYPYPFPRGGAAGGSSEPQLTVEDQLQFFFLGAGMIAPLLVIMTVIRFGRKAAAAPSLD